MLYGLVVVVHVLICLVLMGVILMQGGRGGLSDALGGAAAQSLFGGGVATVMTRVTAICAGLFVVTCLSLAALSTIKGRSVIEQLPAPFATSPDAEQSTTSGTPTPQASDSSASP